MRVAVAAILKDGAFFSDHPLIEAMALEPQVQDILAEAAADEVRFDEASPLPAAWAAAAACGIVRVRKTRAVSLWWFRHES